MNMETWSAVTCTCNLTYYWCLHQTKHFKRAVWLEQTWSICHPFTLLSVHLFSLYIEQLFSRIVAIILFLIIERCVLRLPSTELNKRCHHQGAEFHQHGAAFIFFFILSLSTFCRLLWKAGMCSFATVRGNTGSRSPHRQNIITTVCNETAVLLPVKWLLWRRGPALQLLDVSCRLQNNSVCCRSVSLAGKYMHFIYDNTAING